MPSAKPPNRIRYIHTRHEESAALAACGYAKFSGRLGVCFATTGPGAVHLLNGLYDAKVDGAPVLAITGMTYHDFGEVGLETCPPRLRRAPASAAECAGARRPRCSESVNKSMRAA